MTIDRAIEIINSSSEVRVLYANDPIWIEGIDTDKRTAVVRIIGTSQVEEVPISSLTDTGSTME